MPHKVLLFIWFLIFTIPTVKGKNQQFTDSLNNLINTTKNDTIKLQALLKLSEQYIFSDTKKAIDPCNTALKISEQIKNSNYKIKAIIRLGVCYFQLGDYEKSTTYYKNGLELAKQINNQEYIEKFSGNLAINYTFTSNYEQALEILYQLNNIYIKKADTVLMASNMLDMANVYYYLKNYEKGYTISTESYLLAKQTNSLKLQANALGSIALFADSQQKTAEALINNKKSNEIRKIINDYHGQVNSLINIANNYKDLGQNNLSILYLDSAYVIAQKYNFENSLAIINTNIGNAFSTIGQYHKAIEPKLKAYNYYKINKMYKDQMSIALNIASSYKDIGNYKKSAQYYREAYYLNDTIFNSEMNRNIADMQIKYETEKKEQENLNLAKENQIKELKIEAEKQKREYTIILSAILFLIIITAFLFAFYRYKIIKRTETEKRVAYEKNLRLIEVIETEEKERERIARELHDGLGQLLSTTRINIAALDESVPNNDRNFLTNALQLIDQSVTEVRNISHNLMPVSLTRYGFIAAINEIARKINDTKKILVNCNFDNFNAVLPQNTERTAYRLVQEIINNTIKHANASYINITIKNKNNTIFITTQNNGQTLSMANIKNPAGLGLNNIFTRVAILNGTINISPNQNGGTIINISFTV